MPNSPSHAVHSLSFICAHAVWGNFWKCFAGYRAKGSCDFELTLGLHSDFRDGAGSFQPGASGGLLAGERAHGGQASVKPLVMLPQSVHSALAFVEHLQVVCLFDNETVRI